MVATHVSSANPGWRRDTEGRYARGGLTLRERVTLVVFEPLELEALDGTRAPGRRNSSRNNRAINQGFASSGALVFCRFTREHLLYRGSVRN
jgi:hypothetical protein